MSTYFSMEIYTSKIQIHSSRFSKIKNITYHFIFDDGLNNQSKNQDYNLKGKIIEIMMNGTTTTKQYE